MPNPELYQITLPSGVTYDLKDAQARSDIADIRNAVSGGVSFLGVTTTALTENDTTGTIVIGGNNHTSTKGDLVAYGDKEFLFDGAKWIEVGDLGAFKSLAYKDSASGTFTPAGTVSKPDITITPTTENVYSITDVGSLPELSMTVVDGNLTIAFNQGSLPTKGTAQAVMASATAALNNAPSFTGTADTVTVT